MSFLADTSKQSQTPKIENRILQELNDWKKLANLPPYKDFLTSSATSLMMLCRVLSRKPNLLTSLETGFIHPRLINASQAPDVKVNLESPLQIPRIRAEDADPNTIMQMLKHFPLPIVLEGLAKDCEAIHSWSPNLFKEKYGEFKVCVDNTYTSGSNGNRAALGEIIDEVQAGTEGGRYVQNISNLFLEYPELEQQLPLEKIQSCLPNTSRLFGIQLFLGGPGTGSHFHCANGVNFFVNVYGEKEWTFVSPYHSPWMYPKMHITGIHFMSAVDYRKTPADQQQAFPLYSQIPIFKAHLRSGDVLINVPWWWHAIKNLTPVTIGCSTRWGVPGVKRINPFYATLSNLSPHILTKVLKEFLFNPNARMRDEIFREVYHKDYENYHRFRKNQQVKP